MSTALSDSQPHPLYYLHNFLRVLDWVDIRYPDLLNHSEQAFITRFRELPVSAQALLVRMVMRKGIYFRRSKLNYAEIGDHDLALAALQQQGMLIVNPELTLSEAGRLLTANEVNRLATRLEISVRTTKTQLLTNIEGLCLAAQPWTDWHIGPSDPVYALTVMPECDRLRLMFFGNLHQAWSTFVLEELGLQRYELVPFDHTARPFNRRDEVDIYLTLHACREALDEGSSAQDILPLVPDVPDDNHWLLSRRDRLLYTLAYQLERAGQTDLALSLYSGLRHPEARVRQIRVLERQERLSHALELALEVQKTPANEAESQHMARILLRLSRKLKIALPSSSPTHAAAPTRITPTETDEMTLAPLTECVERDVVVALHTAEAPVFFVENGLINSLLGLLCWPAVFANIPGAFFHPYQAGPADLNQPDFLRRRETLIADQLALLDSEAYKGFIRTMYQVKYGLQSPFVYWPLLTEELLELSLTCIPATDLNALFTRILFDIPSNRSGLPDLIQFWPEQARYCLIEVKGPGDRLQDNQRRWLSYFAAHGIPAQVVMVKRP
ncbi:MAG: VRR-NUC domain-containing protein [Natronospirillum sp.]